jgi:hypothetical protein
VEGRSHQDKHRAPEAQGNLDSDPWRCDPRSIDQALDRLGFVCRRAAYERGTGDAAFDMIPVLEVLRLANKRGTGADRKNLRRLANEARRALDRSVGPRKATQVAPEAERIVDELGGVRANSGAVASRLVWLIATETVGFADLNEPMGDTVERVTAAVERARCRKSSSTQGVVRAAFAAMGYPRSANLFKAEAVKLSRCKS